MYKRGVWRQKKKKTKMTYKLERVAKTKIIKTVNKKIKSSKSFKLFNFTFWALRASENS